MIRKLVITLGLATCMLFTSSNAQAALLSDLISGGSLVSGNLEFTDFGYTVDSGSLSPPEYVNVVPITDVAGHHGIRIHSGFLDLPGGDAALGTLRYTVTLNDEQQVIHDIHLAGNPIVVAGTGSVDVVKTVVDAVPAMEPPLGTLSIYDDSGDRRLIDWQDLTATTRSARVTTRLELAGESGIATLSFVDETFSLMIPEPSSALLFVTGLIGLVRLRRVA